MSKVSGAQIIIEISNTVFDKIPQVPRIFPRIQSISKVAPLIERFDEGLDKPVSDFQKMIERLPKPYLSRIITERRELKLRESIDINVAFKEDMLIFEYPELNIISCGETYKDTIESFQEDFIELFEHYALGDPKKMTGNALKIREIFKKLVVD